MIPESFIQELLSRIDIVEVINKVSPLKRTGKNFMCCCPFHKEKTPSFSVSQQKQFFKCFGCGASGNVIGFLMRYEGLSYPEAIRKLAESIGMTVPETPRDRETRTRVRSLTDMMKAASDYYSASLKTNTRTIEYLKQRGIAALDAVVVTHPDADHTNGILELLELIGEQKTALRIRHLFLPVWMKGSEKENPFILAAQKAGIMVEYLKKGDEIRAGELTVSVLHPGAGEDYTGEENAGSVVLQLSCGACRALLTGDLEGSGEEEVLGAAERCQILKVAHHGSRNSTSEAFLNRIQPQISLISCAWPGRYGHPHRELLERLRACKSHIYGTPVDGAVTVQLKRDRLAVHGYWSDVEFPVS